MMHIGSFSKVEADGIYIPLAHRHGQNAADQDALWDWLGDAFFQSADIIKIAHNLSFEAMFLYARSIMIQAPVYDTIAASQMTLKSNSKYRGLGESGLKTLVPELFGVQYIVSSHHLALQ